MPQIPVVTPGQRLDPGSPVAALSGESAGEKAGKAAAALGEAVFNLGNALDKADKRNKEKEERETLAIAVGKARIMMLQKQAEQAQAQIKDGDRSGFGAAEAYKAAIDPELDTIAQQLPAEYQRGFYAAIADDVTQTTTGVYATEVQKREKYVPVLKQEGINTAATLARKYGALNQYDKAVNVGLEQKLKIMNDPDIPEAQKLAMGQKVEKDIAEGVIEGVLERAGKSKSLNQFAYADKVLRSKYNKVFSPDEMTKLSDRISKAKEDFLDRDWKESEQLRRVGERVRAEEYDKKRLTYSAKLEAAGANQFAIDQVFKEIDNDRFLKQEEKDTIKKYNFSQERINDEYEARFLSKLYDTNDFAASRRQLEKDYKSGSVTADRWSKLVKQLDEFKQKQRVDPTMMEQVRAGKAAILGAYKESIIYMPDGSLLAKNEQGQDAIARYNRFALAVASDAQTGSLTPGQILYRTKEALKGTPAAAFYNAKPGTYPLQTIKDPDKDLQAIKDKWKNEGSKMSPKEKQETLKKIMELKQIKDSNQIRDDLNEKLNSTPRKAED